MDSIVFSLGNPNSSALICALEDGIAVRNISTIFICKLFHFVKPLNDTLHFHKVLKFIISVKTPQLHNYTYCVHVNRQIMISSQHIYMYIFEIKARFTLIWHSLSLTLRGHLVSSIPYYPLAPYEVQYAHFSLLTVTFRFFSCTPL